MQLSISNIRGYVLISERSLAGYVLEELLARELQDSGFRLLQKRSDDSNVLREQANGLAVLGRGGLHQADVLGELSVRPRFTHPIRLFLEAKHQPDSPVGIEAVRNAVGVISDVREHYTQDHARKRWQRFSYRYALFSSGGFADSAVDYATTHDISTIDLSEPAWDSITRKASDIAVETLRIAGNMGMSRFPVNVLRHILRARLIDEDYSALAAAINQFTGGDDRAKRDLLQLAESIDGDLFGQVALLSPGSEIFTLGLVPDGSDLDRLSNDKARLRYEKRSVKSGVWTLTPSSRSAKPTPLALPPRLEEVFFGGRSAAQAGGERRLRIDILTSDIDPISIEVDRVPTGDNSAAGWRKTRAEFQQEAIPSVGWQRASASVFLDLLRSRSPKFVQVIDAAMMRFAAGSSPSVHREEVYELMGYEESRSLRGFTRPIRSIVLQMIENGLVEAEVDWPMVAVYESGVRATQFRLSPDFATALS